MFERRKGFTLIEILLVVTAVSLLAGVVIIAINPARQLGKMRDSARESDARTILDAVYQYNIDNNEFPTPIDGTLRMVGTASTGCNMNCGGSGDIASTITDNDQTEFDEGTYTNTAYGGGVVGLSLPSTSGTYTSSIKNTSTLANWSTFSWVPSRPVGKELPDNGTSETAYAAGNANMSGNILMMHMNDNVSGPSQTIFDSSGNNDHGTTVNNPNCTAAGKLNGGCDFPAGTNYVTIDNINVNTAPGAYNTVSFWMYWRGTSGQMPFGWQQAYDLWLSGGCFGFNTGQGNVFGMPYTGLANGWHHVSAVFYNGIPSAGTTKLYIDGVEQTIYACSGTTSASRTVTAAAQISGWRLGAGYYFNGIIDELSIFNRELSATEIADQYKRGALNMQFAFRTCDDAACSGESFTGAYSELDNDTTGLPSVNINSLTGNQYFQYRATLLSGSSSITPAFSETEVGYTGAEGGETTASACIDLSSYLVSDYITDIPYDSTEGSEEMTYYAIKRTGNDRVYVRACNPEFESEIMISR